MIERFVLKSKIKKRKKESREDEERSIKTKSSASKRNTKTEGGVSDREKTGSGAVRHNVPVHAQILRHSLRMQIHSKAETGVQRRLRRRFARDSDHASPLRTPPCRPNQSHLRGLRLRPLGHGALRWG